MKVVARLSAYLFALSYPDLESRPGELELNHRKTSSALSALEVLKDKMDDPNFVKQEALEPKSPTFNKKVSPTRSRRKSHILTRSHMEIDTSPFQFLSMPVPTMHSEMSMTAMKLLDILRDNLKVTFLITCMLFQYRCSIPCFSFIWAYSDDRVWLQSSSRNTLMSCTTQKVGHRVCR